MAESVDALVSNTSGATHPGSSPGLGTKVQKSISAAVFFLQHFFVNQQHDKEIIIFTLDIGLYCLSETTGCGVYR